MSTTDNLFEKASRLKVRFDSPVGQLTVEALWDLPLTSANKANLDSIAVGLNRELKGTEESFVSTGTKNAVLDLKFEIVKYIISVRVAENAAKLEAAQVIAKRAKLDELIAQKQDESLASKSLDDLQKLRDSLG